MDPAQLSRAISPQTWPPAYTRFTPSDSGQRSPPTYYRGCWHVVSRGFFPRYRLVSSRRKALYTPKGFIAHAASLRQACAHCGRFLTAASRRSLGRVSVPVWLIILSDQQLIVALGGHYPSQLANQTQAPPWADLSFPSSGYGVLAAVSSCYPPPRGRSLRVTHPSATAPYPERYGAVQLACVRQTASVHPEPGSNSH